MCAPIRHVTWQKYHWYGVCEGPRARHSTKCDDLKWCIRQEKVFEQGEKERKLVKDMNSLLQGDVQSVMISGVQEKDSFTRVPCQPQPLIRAKGYWLGREWVNRDCSLGSTSQKIWWQCLTNRSLLFIGDSTVRQLHLSMLQSAGIFKQAALQRLTSKLRDVYRKQYNASIDSLDSTRSALVRTLRYEFDRRQVHNRSLRCTSGQRKRDSRSEYRPPFYSHAV